MTCKSISRSNGQHCASIFCRLLVHSYRQRPYHVECTASRPISEVKQRWAWLVLGWVTAWEHQVLLAFYFLEHFFLSNFCFQVEIRSMSKSFLGVNFLGYFFPSFTLHQNVSTCSEMHAEYGVRLKFGQEKKLVMDFLGQK